MNDSAPAVALQDLPESDQNKILGLVVGNAIRNVLIREIENNISKIAETQEWKVDIEIGSRVSDSILNLADTILQDAGIIKKDEA